MQSKKYLKTLMILLLGSIIYTTGVNIFLTPLNIYPVGVMGISFEATTIITNYFPNLDASSIRSIMYFLINIPLILLAFKGVGKRFTIKTVFTIIFISLFTKFIPVPATSPINDTLLSVVASGCITGFGLGILLNEGTSTGGTDIIALYFALTKNKPFGTFNLIFNTFVIILAVVILKDFNVAIYMLVLVYVLSLVTDKVHNISQKYTLFIISNNGDDIKNALYSSGMTRGITIYDTRGGFTNKPNKTLMITCEKIELYQINNLILETDSKAFINVFSTSHVYGEFTKRYNQMLK